ncbi:MAG: hypothetical protein A2Z16_08700 [Chloroflexi bacterium RBG_16_54_18]|nr:MAG: hypothetical protein A2Z16_08700 [Chloroflexi bacterium RBG_16_54_18]
MEELSSPTSTRFKIIRVAGTLITISLLLYLFFMQGWSEILAGIRLIPTWILVASLGLTLVSRLAVAARWHVLLVSAGVPISARNSLRITFAGLFATNFLPTTIGGDVIRLAGAIRLKFDAAVCAASLVVDRLVGMAGMAMILPFCLPGLPEITGAARLPAFVLLTSTSNKMCESLLNKIRASIHKIRLAFELWRKNPRSLVISLAWSWVHMLSVFSILWLLFYGLGESISFWLVSGLYSLVYFFTLIPISINGYGLQEISMTFVFYQMGGLSLSSSLTAALLFRTLMIIGSLPGAFFIPGMLTSSNPLRET